MEPKKTQIRRKIIEIRRREYIPTKKVNHRALALKRRMGEGV